MSGPIMSGMNAYLVPGNPTASEVRVIIGEAGNQGLAGMTAVADVIHNRVAAGTYGGNDVVSVIAAPGQFQGVSLAPGATDPSSAQYKTALQAIALANSGVDITGGATFYANPSASTAAWARNLNDSNSVQIGQHFFTNNVKGNPFGAGLPDMSLANSKNLTADQIQAIANTGVPQSVLDNIISGIGTGAAAGAAGGAAAAGLGGAVGAAAATTASGAAGGWLLDGAAIIMGVVLIGIGVYVLAGKPDLSGYAAKAAIAA